jgi:acyl-coenzyme A synthetase/AMP-(fatty) acid ligase
MDTPATNLLPLMTHTSANDIVAFRHSEAITVRQFLADVEQIRAMLLPGKHVLNVCHDRYRFMVGLAAVMTANKISLLPSTYTNETINQMLRFAPDVFCLNDADNDINLPQLRLSDLSPKSEVHKNIPIPLLPGNLPVGYVFTSGSSGSPVPHLKRWAALVGSARSEAQRLGLFDGRKYTVLGTVPPQHMYGLESTILIVLQSGGALSSPQYFYPADIGSEFSSLPRPRLLVSTPIHLRALLSANICLPTADLLVSATAPLPQDLAQKAEASFEAPLQEIYGSTETGLIATRRTAQTDAWTLLPGLHLTKEAEHLWVGGGHLAQKTEISDNLEVLNKEQFLLQGRAADLVNIAGKRSSLEYLNHQLNSIPEVQDGVFFMPEDGMPGSVSRLIAFVVARGVDAQLINTKLRERIDPAFLPRPLHMVDALPRNNTGKLPREALLALVTAYHKRGNNPDTA